MIREYIMKDTVLIYCLHHHRLFSFCIAVVNVRKRAMGSSMLDDESHFLLPLLINSIFMLVDFKSVFVDLSYLCA